MLVWRVRAWLPEGWWTWLEKGPNRTQNSTWLAALRVGLVGPLGVAEARVEVGGSLTREIERTGVVNVMESADVVV